MFGNLIISVITFVISAQNLINNAANTTTEDNLALVNSDHRPLRTNSIQCYYLTEKQKNKLFS